MYAITLGKTSIEAVPMLITLIHSVSDDKIQDPNNCLKKCDVHSWVTH